MGGLSRGLLDTSVVIDEEEIREALPQEISISVATLAELHFGVMVAKTEESRQHRLRRLGAIEAAFHPIPIDARVARAFAAVAHAVRMTGRQPRSRVMDLWIAATGLAHRLPVYTRNGKDFEGLEGLIEVKIV
ncbi:MAG TPA: type II toxin-antitoxin system VapC family toxin [Thermoanaerobaculia bacterium]